MATPFATATILQQVLAYIKANLDVLVIVTGEPTNYADIVNIDIATKTGIVSGDWTGPQANGANQELILAAFTGLTVDTAGTSDKAVLHDGVAEYIVFEANNQSIALGNTVNTSSVTITATQPT